MFTNYLTVALRNLLKYKLYSFVNILGMAFGIAFFTIILLLIRHELSYDKFHAHYPDIYRAIKITEKDGLEERSACMPFPFAPTVMGQYPDAVAATVRLFNFQVPTHSLNVFGKLHSEPLFYFADSTFFQVFSYPLAVGDTALALATPLSVVISHEKAEEYFGDTNPIGKKINYEGMADLTVTGVFAPQDRASHFKFDFVANLSSLTFLSVDPQMLYDNWKWDPCWTYIRLQRGASPEDLEENLVDLVQANFPPAFRDESRIFLQPLTEIHLYSDLEHELEPNGDARYVVIFAAIGVLILIIATINFANLSSAKSSLRAREIGIRKAIGAFKYELAEQFLVEHVLIGLVSVVFAFIFIELMLPLTPYIAGVNLRAMMINSKVVTLSIVGAGALIGAFSSIYPAYYLSRFHPSEMLSGSSLVGMKGQQFRAVLIITQLVITVFLLITTFVSLRQFLYLRFADVGFEHETVIILPTNNADLRFVYDSIRANLMESSDIVAVTAIEDVLGATHRTHDYLAETADPARQQWMFFPSLMVRPDFMDVFQIELIAGRTFHPDSLGDAENAVVVNEEMVRYLGWASPEEALGKMFRSRVGNERIIGVTRNFHFESLHNKVSPFVFDVPTAKFSFFFTKYIAVRCQPRRQLEALQHTRETWFAFLPNRTFEHQFLSKHLDKLYYKERKLSEINAHFALAAILIAGLGMFGLSSFIVGIRKKEIAIRKAIGTTDLSIAWLLIKEFLTLVAIAVAIAIPIGYFVMANWLNSFPFHVPMPWDIFIVSAAIVFLATIFTVSFHTVRAAMEEPAEALQA